MENQEQGKSELKVENPNQQETTQPQQPKEGDLVKTQIVIEWGYVKGEGYSVRLGKDTQVPNSDILIRGMMEKAKDMLLGFHYEKMMQAEERKIKIAKSDSMGLGIKGSMSNFRKKIMGR